MSQQFGLRPEHAREILTEAARNHTVTTITWETAGGWVMVKTRLCGLADEGNLLIELPPAAEPAQPAPQLGQSIGVSFRRGSRKCVFDSAVVGQVELSRQNRQITALRVAWPDDVQELQRRLYQRTQVPRGRFIPVELWIEQAGGESAETSPQRGKMLDLSAGGVSIELPHENRPRWREDDRLACRFATDPDRQPIEIPARLTHYSRDSAGHVRLGLQFVGLEACDGSRQKLHRIHQMASRLRRSRHGDGA